MGCTESNRQKIENEMMMLKIQRIGIRKERIENIKLLGGSPIDFENPIPDYIDPAFAIKRGMYHEIEMKKKNEIKPENDGVRRKQKSVTFKVDMSKRRTKKFSRCEPKLRKIKSYKKK